MGFSVREFNNIMVAPRKLENMTTRVVNIYLLHRLGSLLVFTILQKEISG